MKLTYLLIPLGLAGATIGGAYFSEDVKRIVRKAGIEETYHDLSDTIGNSSDNLREQFDRGREQVTSAYEHLKQETEQRVEQLKRVHRCTREEYNSK